MSKKNVLVFPCGSEIGLEVYQSLKYSTHFHLIGGSSVQDHGIFTYSDYEGNFPFITAPDFFTYLKEFISKREIDIIYPAMDSVIAILKSYESQLNCIVVGPSPDTCSVCNSKLSTYRLLNTVVKTPTLFERDEVSIYPVFAKPDSGYGSRGVAIIKNKQSLDAYSGAQKDFLLMEYLPGDEFTIDCCSNKDAELIFINPRKRQRIMNGISVNAVPVTDEELSSWAHKINEKMKFKGAWFFQVKKNKEGKYVLLEVAARIAGSSGICKAYGVNLAELSIYIALNQQVSIIQNKLEVLTDRSLSTSYQFVNLQFDTVYVDLDDTLIINNSQVNSYLIGKLHEYINNNKRIILITKHQQDVNITLARFRLLALFDEVLVIDKSARKSDFIASSSSIFIDDSFAERKDVAEAKNIPVFSPNLVP